MNVFWSDEDDADMDRWNREDIEAAGGPLLHYAYWKKADDEWTERVRQVCNEERARRTAEAVGEGDRRGDGEAA